MPSVPCPHETAETTVLSMKLALAEAARLDVPVEGVTVKSDHGSTFTADAFQAFLL